MGIKGLAKLLSDEAPDSIREVELKSLHGRKIAIDASMSIYQFLIAVRSNGGGGPNQQSFQLTNADGETTSHIQGMFNRTVRYLSEGLQPVFVFDGAPPQMKSGELQKRRQRRDQAQAALKVAQDEQNVAEVDKQNKRLVRAGPQENADCQKLLRLMGVPVVLAPCEAEAQAAHLARTGQVYATGTEDMDALTFATPILLRKMTFAGQSKSLIQSINYAKAIEGLGISHDAFVDLCILLGCDYCDTIRGVGPKTALKLIRDHGCIETILETIDRQKFAVPASWIPNDSKNNNNDSDHDDDDDNEEKDDSSDDFIPAYVQARKLFKEHEVLDQVELKWRPCQAAELTKFLVDDMGFNPERVQSSIDKLTKAYQANSKPQMRMDNFFAAKPNPNASKIAAKRKAEAQAAMASAKKKKMAAKKKR